MSRSPSEPGVRLSVQAPDETTEVFVVDSRFRRIASGVGTLEADVSPGLYKVRFRSGATQQDRLVEVPPDRESVHVRGEHVRFRASAPIPATATTRAAHQKAARRESRRVHARDGAGSQVFVFARDLADEPAGDPFEGVSLHTIDGGLVTELGAAGRGLADRCAALNVEVDPGTYRLRVETEPLGTYEMFVVSVEGWQTQVFMVVEDFRSGTESVRRPGLSDSSVLMSRMGVGFVPDGESARLAELARIGLESGRDVVRDEELTALVHGKLDDPMLGIYGAHLLANRRRPDHDLIDAVCDGLTAAIGRHPDVDALALRSAKGTAPSDLAFPTPPMLLSSWDLIVRGSRRRNSLVPPGSLSDTLADGFLSMGPWLLHRLTETPSRESLDVSIARARRQLERLVELGASTKGLGRLEEVQQEGVSFSPLENGILQAAIQARPFTTSARRRDIEAAALSMPQLMRALGAPASSVARSTESLVAKLGLTK